MFEQLPETIGGFHLDMRLLDRQTVSGHDLYTALLLAINEIDQELRRDRSYVGSSYVDLTGNEAVALFKQVW